MDASQVSEGFDLANPGDAVAMTELARRAYAHYIPVINAVPVPMTADYAAHIRQDDVWVLRSSTTLAASLVLIRHPDHLLIESIAVDPEEQGKGRGRQLLDWARRRAAPAAADRRGRLRGGGSSREDGARRRRAGDRNLAP